MMPLLTRINNEIVNQCAILFNCSGILVKLLVLLIVSSMWGILSPRLFLRSWLSFLAILATLFFFFQSWTKHYAFFLLFCKHVTVMLFTFILLFAGFYILYFHLPFGNSDAEVLVYWFFSTIQLALILPKISIWIDQMLEQIKGISLSARGL